MTEAYNNHIYGKIYIMAILVKMSSATADRNLVHLIYKLVPRPIPTLVIFEKFKKQLHLTMYIASRLRHYDRCANCHNCVSDDDYCQVCIGNPKRYLDIEHINLYETNQFTINDVTFNITDTIVTVRSKYNTMQFNAFRLRNMSVKITGGLAYILTGYEFTIVCLRYGRVLRQWHDRRHKKEYPGEEAVFKDSPLNFIVEPDGQITINGPYRTYLINYEN